MEHGISLFPELVTWLFTSYWEQFSGGTVFCLQNETVLLPRNKCACLVDSYWWI